MLLGFGRTWSKRRCCVDASVMQSSANYHAEHNLFVVVNVNDLTRTILRASLLLQAKSM